MTKNSNLILDLITNSHDHPTAEDIYYKIRMDGRKMSMATVYNSLNTLCEDGLIRRVNFDGKAERYDKTVPHDHMICSVCGKITDIKLDDLTQILEQQSGKKLDSYDLKLYYVCDGCKEALKEG